MNSVTWQRKTQTFTNQSRSWLSQAQQKYGIGNIENKRKDKHTQHILHRTGFLTKLQWLHPPLAAGNNYRCGLNLDPVVFSSQWNMGPSLKQEKKKERKNVTWNFLPLFSYKTALPRHWRVVQTGPLCWEDITLFVWKDELATAVTKIQTANRAR